MACKVKIQPTATRELEEIVSYLSELGPQSAKDFMDEWDQKLETLRDVNVEYALSRFPVLAELGYRVYHVKRYVVLYYREHDVVYIAHVFHMSRGYANLV